MSMPCKNKGAVNMAGKTTSGDLDVFRGKLVNVLVGLGDSAT